MEKIMQQRGQLTARVQQKAVEVMSREISLDELRLMPYIKSMMMDFKRIDKRKMNLEDIYIFERWVDEGRVLTDWNFNGSFLDIKITKEFWDQMSEIIYLSYVDST